MSGRLLTLQDLEAFYGLGTDITGLGAPTVQEITLIRKAAGDISTALGEPYWNAVYGAYIWFQQYLRAPAFASLPKTTWPSSGFRVLSGLSHADPLEIATSEGGPIAAATRPEITTITLKPKVQNTSFEVSEVLHELGNATADDVWGAAHQIRVIKGIEFLKAIDQQLVRRALGVNNATSEDPTVAPAVNALEPIDRIISNYEEAQLALGGGAPIGTKANAYGGQVDRTTAPGTWADSVVLHNSGQLRPVSFDLFTEALNASRARGGEPTMWMTGPDTYAQIQAFVLDNIRYEPLEAGFTKVDFGLEGVKAGIDHGTEVAALFGLPIIMNPHLPKEVDATGAEIPNSLQRVYLIDTHVFESDIPRASVSVLRPIEYMEVGGQLMAVLGRFIIRGVYRFIGETAFRGIAYQAKIRDLSAA